MAGVDYSQFKGKPFQVISKLGVRYTGIFDHISQEDQTICLAEVYNHGTEDRLTARKLAGSQTTLGWVRFHTESIESLALVENYVPPGSEEPQDPILASVGQAPPSASAPPTATSSASPQPSAPRRDSSTRHDLPSKPSGAAISAATALDRVQASLQDLSVDSRPRRGGRAPPNAQAPEVPDAEFDFSKGTEVFEKERVGRKGSTAMSPGSEDVGEPELPPHPAAISSKSPPPTDSHLPEAGKDGKKSSVYSKGSFFDGLSGESSRISRNEERSRNYDTFGEAGGREQYGQANGPAGGYGNGGYGRGRGRGGYRGGYRQGQQGYGQDRYDQGQGGGSYGDRNGNGYGGRGRDQNQYGYGGRGRGGYRGGYQGQQQYQRQDSQ